MNNLDTTQELNPIQRCFGKVNLELNKKPTKVLILYLFLPLLLGTILVLLFSPYMSAVYVVVGAGLLFVFVSSSRKSEMWKKQLPEYKIEQARQKLGNALKRAELIIKNDPLANTETTNRLLENAKNVKNDADDLEVIQSATKNLEEIVKMVNAIREKEIKIKTIKTDYGNLPWKEQKLEELKKRFEANYP